MENQFLVDSEYLTPRALEKKHRLENDPAARTDHMAYLPGMEVIESDICEKVMSQVEQYDYHRYTAKDVKAALEHETCTLEDFKALLSPAAEPFLEQMTQIARVETGKHFGNTVYLFTPLYISTGIGDHESKYTGKEADDPQGDEQFEIDDNRSLDKMYQDIAGEGLQPVLNDYLYV